MLGVFLDTETNGLNPQEHRIIEIAYKLVNLETGLLLNQYENIISQTSEQWAKSDPESLKINDFSWREIQEKGVSEGKIVQEIANQFSKHGVKRKQAVFICQNPSFDRIFFSQLINPNRQEALFWPYHWLDLASMYWALAIERTKRKEGPPPWKTGFSKDMIATYYHIPREDKPHRAMNGVSHLLLCYTAMLGFPSALLH